MWQISNIDHLSLKFINLSNNSRACISRFSFTFIKVTLFEYHLSERITALLTVFKCARAKENNCRLLETVDNEKQPRKKVVACRLLLSLAVIRMRVQRGVTKPMPSKITSLNDNYRKTSNTPRLKRKHKWTFKQMVAQSFLLLFLLPVGHLKMLLMHGSSLKGRIDKGRDANW